MNVEEPIATIEIPYEFVLAKGYPLDKLLAKKLPTVAWIDMMINVLKAVKDLHDNGVLHCDLNLQNIYYDLITKKATPINFDLAHHTSGPEEVVRGVQGKHAKGTPSNMSLDALMGLNNEKSEIYALAIIFAEILDLADSESKYIKPLKKRLDVLEVRKEDYESGGNIITDNNTRKAILTMLQFMSQNENNLSLQAIPGHINPIKFFEDIREEYIDTLGLTCRIAYFNIADYLETNAKNREKMLTALINADEVWLIDNNGANKNNYLTIQQELACLNVSNIVIQYQDNNLDKIMQDYAEQREQSDRNIYDCSYVTKTGQLAHLETTLEKHQVNMLVASLNQEVSRQLNNYGPTETQHRTRVINDTLATIQKIYVEQAITLDKALRELDKLQTSLLSDPESQRHIIQLMQELENLAPRKAIPSTAAKGFDVVKKHHQTHKKVLQQLSNLQQRVIPTGGPLPIPAKKMPPPLPVGYNAPAITKKMPPPLPPPIPLALQAELNARKLPEYEKWLQTKPEYTRFIEAAIAGIQKSFKQQNTDKVRNFVDDELLSGTTFYINLLESADTLFQKAIILHSILKNKSKKYNELKNVIVKKISADMDLASDKPFFKALKDLCPKKVDTFLAALEKKANSKDPFIFKDKIVQQLKQLDPTPENVKENQPKA
jgi:serine/threonine protein kinase